MKQENNTGSIKIQKAPPPGSLRLPELYAIALGYVIGAGIVSYVGPAIALTGRSSYLAYLAAIFFGLLLNLPALFITSTLRMGGGPYSMLAGLAGKKVAGIYSIIYIALLIQMSVFGVAIGNYIHALWPVIPVKWAAVAVLTFFFVANLFGVDVMAKLQKAMTWILIASFLVFIVMGIPKMDMPVFNTSDPDFMTHGSSGFIAAVLLFVNSTNGYLMTMSYGRAAKKATRDIPRAILLCVPTFIVLYCGVALVYGGIVPMDGVAKTTLVNIAKKIFSTPLFVAFMIGGPFMAITSTMNSAMANNTIPIAQSAKDGWLPRGLATENRYGVNWKVLLIIYITGLIPILFGLQIVELAMMINLALGAQSFLYTISYWNLPKRYPEAWAKSKFHLPLPLYRIIVILAFLGWVVLFVHSLRQVSTPVLIIAIIFFAVAVTYGLLKSRDESIKIEVSMWTDEECRAAEEAVEK